MYIYTCAQSEAQQYTHTDIYQQQNNKITKHKNRFRFCGQATTHKVFSQQYNVAVPHVKKYNLQKGKGHNIITLIMNIGQKPKKELNDHTSR